MEKLNNDGELMTLHGTTSRGFPNMYWPGVSTRMGAVPEATRSVIRETMTDLYFPVFAAVTSRSSSEQRFPT